jgi:hypothetical protein
LNKAVFFGYGFKNIRCILSNIQDGVTMLSQGFHQVLIPRAKVLNLLWGAFMAAPLFYVIVAWVLFGKSGSGETLLDDGLATGGTPLTIASIVALGLLVTSVFVERIMLSSDGLACKAKGTPNISDVFPTNNSTSKSDPKLEMAYESLSEPEKRLAAMGAQYQTAMIVVWAMREGVVVVGLVLALSLSSFTTVLPFAGAALVGLGLKAPRPISFFERNLGLARKFG